MATSMSTDSFMFAVENKQYVIGGVAALATLGAISLGVLIRKNLKLSDELKQTTYAKERVLAETTRAKDKEIQGLHKQAATSQTIENTLGNTSSPSLDILSQQVSSSDILWAIAEHENASPSEVGDLLKSFEMTKVIDQKEQHHKERDWCAKEKTVYVIVDVEEESHWEYDPAEIKRIAQLLLGKTEDFLDRVVSGKSLDRELVAAVKEAYAIEKGQIQ
jgi:hypothetical protein